MDVRKHPSSRRRRLDGKVSDFSSFGPGEAAFARVRWASEVMSAKTRVAYVELKEQATEPLGERVVSAAFSPAQRIYGIAVSVAFFIGTVFMLTSLTLQPYYLGLLRLTASFHVVLFFGRGDNVLFRFAGRTDQISSACRAVLDFTNAMAGTSVFGTSLDNLHGVYRL